MAIYHAGSTSQTDVQNAINSGVNGDTVVIPAGTGYWFAGGNSMNIGAGITLKGAGTAGTVITLASDAQTQNGNLQLTATGATVQDIGFIGYPDKGLFQLNASNFRTTNIKLDNLTNGSAGYFALVQAAFGLIDNCEIIGGAGNNELVFVRGPENAWQLPSQCGTANAVFMEDCTIAGMGSVCDANSNSSMVVRFCQISGGNKIDGHGFDSNSPPRSCRTLEAYNNIFHYSGVNFLAAFEFRGGAGFGFNNSAINDDGGNFWFEVESYGVQGAWQNYGVGFSGMTTGSTPIITTTAPHLISGVWNVAVRHGSSIPPLSSSFGYTAYTATPIDTYRFSITGITVTDPGSTFDGWMSIFQTPINYPLPDQIGVGQDPKRGGSQPLYLWNNKVAAVNGAGVAVDDWGILWKIIDPDSITTWQQQTSNPSATFTMQTIISGGRDYFKQTVGTPFVGNADVGTGTYAQMQSHTPSQTGVGWYASDTGNWNSVFPQFNGTLYQWNGTSWAPYYTPYTYPHPLRGSGSPPGAFMLRRLGIHPKFSAWTLY